MSAAPLFSFSKDLEELTEEKLEEFRRRGINLARRAGLSFFDAEDVTQDTLLICYTKYSQYEGRAKLKHWFYSILQNEIRDYLRSKNSKKKFSDILDSEKEENNDITPERTYCTQEKKTFLERAIVTQPPLTQIIYHLHTQDGLSFDEIGKYFCVSENSIKIRYHRLRESLKKIMTERKAA